MNPERVKARKIARILDDNDSYTQEDKEQAIAMIINDDSYYNQAEKARNIATILASQCWCKESTKDKVMDPELCTAIAETIFPSLMAMMFYRSLIDDLTSKYGKMGPYDDGAVIEAIMEMKDAVIDFNTPHQIIPDGPDG